MPKLNDKNRQNFLHEAFSSTVMSYHRSISLDLMDLNMNLRTDLKNDYVKNQQLPIRQIYSLHDIDVDLQGLVPFRIAFFVSL